MKLSTTGGAWDERNGGLVVACSLSDEIIKSVLAIHAHTTRVYLRRNVLFTPKLQARTILTIWEKKSAFHFSFGWLFVAIF